MEFDELLVTTKVDALVRLVKEKGKIELGLAAKLLDVEPESVEEWVHILEEEGIVKMDYYLTRAYLTWVKPTEEQAVEEKRRFQEKKATVVEDISRLRSEMEPKGKELADLKKSFDEVYSKLGPRIEKLQQQLSSLPALREKGGAQLEDQLEKAKALAERVDEFAESVSEIKKELAEVRGELKAKKADTPDFAKMEGVKKELSGLGDRLKGVDEKIAAIRKTLPDDKLNRDALQKSLGVLRKEFADVKKSNATMRENITSVKEAFEILGEVDKTMLDRMKKADSLKKDMADLIAEFRGVQNRGKELVEELKGEMDAAEGFKDAVEFAKNALAKFPSPKEVMGKMDELNRNERSLEAKIDALDKSSSSSAVQQISLDELTKLKDELDERRKELAADVKEIFTAVEKESTTYATFQRIKEKAVTSIEEYTNAIGRMESELESIRKESGKIGGDIDAELGKLKGKVDDKAVAETLKAAEEIEAKGRALNDIAESLDALGSAAEDITKKLNLLSKEAAIVSLRSEGGGGTVAASKAAEKETDLRHQLELTRNEQADFDRKREELRELIKKLWEQS